LINASNKKKTFHFVLFRLELIKSFEAPTPIFSASLHPSKSCFVAGGDDFKLYKFDYENGKELGETPVYSYKT